MEGPDYGADELGLTFALKLLEPVSTGATITLQCRFKPSKRKGVTDEQVEAVKQKLIAAITKQWSDVFTLVVEDPLCGTREFPIKYEPSWVDAGQHFVVNIYKKYPREDVDGDARIMNVSVSSDDYTFAHEFGHCISLPDEYGYTKGKVDTLRYIKPDGTLDIEVFLPADKSGDDYGDHTLMSTDGCTIMQPRLAFHVAIEVQKLLRSKLGRLIVCSIKDLPAPPEPEGPLDNRQ